MQLRHLGVSLLSVLAACSGRPQPTAVAPVATASEPSAAPSAASSADAAQEPAADAPVALPTECAAKHDTICLPDPKYVDRLCSNQYASVALVLFAKGTPWTRAYLTRKTKAWNASGGVSSDGELEFDEEVLVLRHRAEDAGAMQVSGAGGGFDALRWDGTCVTLAKEEVTLSRPPVPKAAHVSYRLLEDPFRDAVRADKKVDDVFKVHRAECKGATMGQVSLKCEKADHDLALAIVSAVRGGVPLPEPIRRP